MEINISCSSFSVYGLSDTLWEGVKGGRLVLLLPVPLPGPHRDRGSLGSFGGEPSLPEAADPLCPPSLIPSEITGTRTTENQRMVTSVARAER